MRLVPDEMSLTHCSLFVGALASSCTSCSRAIFHSTAAHMYELPLESARTSLLPLPPEVPQQPSVWDVLQAELTDVICKGVYMPLGHVSSACQSLVAAMLSLRAEERICLDDIRQHAWLRGVQVSEAGGDATALASTDANPPAAVAELPWQTDSERQLRSSLRLVLPGHAAGELADHHAMWIGRKYTCVVLFTDVGSHLPCRTI